MENYKDFKGVAVDSYKLLKDSYYGNGIYEKGKGLIQYPRESVENYRNRQNLAYYLNYTAPIVNASVDPIFKDEIRREFNTNDRFEIFMKDCDRVGADFQTFMRKTATHAKLYGVVFVVVDNESDLSEQKLYNNENRKLPFVTQVLPQDVTDWRFDEKGKLILFQYKTTYRNADGQYKVQTTEWTTTEFKVYEENEVIKQGVNPLGKVPVVQWYGRATDNTEMKPPSEFLSVAQANYYVFQVCSWHSQLLSSQAFSILTMPSVGNDGDITIGTANVLTFDPEAKHRPEFIAPNAAPSQMLTQEVDRVVDEMYRMSGINSVIGVKQSTSGVARQWEFERTNQRLADFAGQCENAEYDIIHLFELWTGDNVDYKCMYPRDFKISDVSEGLANAQQVRDLGFGSKTFMLELMKKVIDVYMPEIEPEIYDEIMKETELHLTTEFEEDIQSSYAGE